MLKDPKFIAAMHKGYIDDYYLNREDFSRFLKEEDARIREIAEVVKAMQQ